MLELRPLPRIPYAALSEKIYDRSHDAGQVTRVQMELTNRCNLHCLHCYTDPLNKPNYFSKEMTTTEVKNILDQIADHGILWVNFTGGECLARADFFDIYDYASQKGFILSIFSNGTTLNEKTVLRFKKNPPFFIEISVHSVHAKAFDAFTQVPGSFQKFLKGLHLLREHQIPFRLKTKAMNWNQQEIPEIRRFVESYGLKFSYTTNLYPRLDGDLGPTRMRLSPAEIKTLDNEQKTWRDDEESCQLISEWIGPPESDKVYRCACATNTIHINAWGELGTCTFEYEKRVSLRKVPLSEAIDQVFSYVRSLSFEKETPCRRCEVHAFCERSATSFQRETGDRENPVPHFCDVAYDRAVRFAGEKVLHPLTHQAKGADDEYRQENLRISKTL